MTHPNSTALALYADGGPGLDDAGVWAVEVHLETCADCRARLAGSTAGDTRLLLDRVAAGLDREISLGPEPAPVRRPWSAVHRRWAVWALLPWLAMTVTVLACAYLLDTVQSELPSLVLLLAPVAPLPCVAIAWTRRADPAWELIAGTPAAGLTMLLRRTAGVLAVVVPVLGLAGAGSGASVALVLLPCLVCTAATIALGGPLGVARAASTVGVVWVAAVVVPSLLSKDLSIVLHAASVPGWALAAVALIAVVVIRGDDYRRLSSRH